MNVSRKGIIAGGAMLLAAGRSAFAQTALTTVRVASNPVNDVTPLIYAQNSGLFKNAGLDVTLEKATNGSAVAAALAGNAIDVGKVSSTAIITAHARGIPLTIIFPDRLHTFGPDSESQIVVPPDSPIRIGRDLNGKTISVGAIKDSTWIGARLFVDAAGGDSTTVKFIELPFSAVTAAVLAKRIDAGVSNAPYLKDDVRAGKVRALGDLLGALGPHFLETAWVCTADYIAKNRDTVARFVRVIHEAQVWCNAHVSEAGDLTSAYTGIDRATVAATKTIFATEADPREMQPYVTACAKYDIIPKSFDAAELYARL
jgi:NitT/TauT family transport system substrate-binding protein